ncbi:hypothetical protein IEE92_06010 [Kocuria sp. cx-116]|uniref:hypothetical protein n=1 Tax=Kocuria sp. cx-116 TaxID=2771378 RepID=UPI0016882DF9|nr:hypothetical protein [Kocuria sp. cx-116]MBD2762110.1 hypothetical protein [Kocuria sp. cx-116]
MSQPIALGTVLGGRYQVTASLLTSADGDHVLQGEDQILRRRVSILVPGDHHEQLMVSNARSLASGSGSDRFQILDLGQAHDTTYLVTSYAPAADLLDTLLVAENELEDESLSDDIFGDSRSAPASPYVYEEPDPTQPHEAVPSAGAPYDDDADTDEGAAPGNKPAVTRWSDDEYEAYENAPAAPSVRNKLGRARKVDPQSTRSTLFDRAASGGNAAAVGASAAAAGKIDPTYDGDNRYESFEATEGSPERLAGYPVGEPETPAQSHSGAGAAGTAGAASAVAGGSDGGSGTGHGSDPSHDPGTRRKKRNGPLRALLLLLLILALLAAVVLGFRALGSLTSQPDDGRDPAPQGGQTASAPQETDADGSAAPTEPRAQAVTRVTSDPNFMAATDATLSQAIDGNPATYWLSYGFSNANFGNLTDYVGLAVELEEPAPVSEVTIDQAGGTGGNFTVYVSASPSMDGAQQVGTGSFTGPQITVPLSQAAQEGEHEYVLIMWEQLPQLTNPIGGYQYGLRIGEVAVR